MMHHYLNKERENGFSLVELLVVIAIIGVLSSVIFVSTQDARREARDTERISDVRQFKIALENYFDDQIPQAYPPTQSGNAWPNLATGGYMPVMHDESTPTIPPYVYANVVISGSPSYCLGVTLEDLSERPASHEEGCLAGTYATLNANYAVRP